MDPRFKAGVGGVGLEFEVGYGCSGLQPSVLGQMYLWVQVQDWEDSGFLKLEVGMHMREYPSLGPGERVAVV